jgi:hypothetical protein
MQPASDAAAAEPRVAGWREDVAALVDGLAKRHKNAFYFTPREQVDAAAAELAERIPSLADHEIVVGLMRIAAMLRDGHTSVGVSPPASPMRTFYPVGLILPDDGLFVASVPAPQRELLGARVTRMGTLTTEQVLTRMAAVISHDNAGALKSALSRLLTPEILHAIGAAQTPDSIELTLVLPGGEERVEAFTALPYGEKHDTALLPDPAAANLPISRRRRTEWYWHEFLPDTRALYVRYDRCANQEGLTVAEFAQRVLEAIEQEKPQRVIIDLRNNGGGNSAFLAPLIGGLAARTELKGTGRLLVLIGRRTQSSAHMNAEQLRRAAGAVLIGEPTGQRPGHFGEVRTFKLPSSGLQVYYSTKLFGDPKGGGDALMPDVAVPILSADFFAGRDAALEAALSYAPKLPGARRYTDGAEKHPDP